MKPSIEEVAKWHDGMASIMNLPAMMRDLHRDAATTIRAAAARWQPIETAPKDGTKIRAYGTRHGSWGYSEDELVSIDAAWCWKERRWIDARDQAFIPRRFTPTHWMPLPEPPQ